MEKESQKVGGLSPKMGHEDVLTRVSEYGQYHRVVFALLMIASVYIAVPLVMVVFFFLQVPFRCSVPGLDNDTYRIRDDAHQSLVNASIPYDPITGEYSQCFAYTRPNAKGDNATTACTKWVFDPDYADSSVVVDLNLVCDRRPIKAQFTMMVMLGLIFGALVAGPAADTLGRKKPMIGFLMTQCVATGVFASITSQSLMLFTLCLIATCSLGTFLNSYTLIIEVLGPRQRALAGLGPMIGWSLGLVVAVPFFYLIPSWRLASLICAGMGLPFITYWWLTPESPRWLLTRNRLDDVQKIFEKMAKVNKVKQPPDLELSALAGPKQEEKKKPRMSFVKALWPVFTSRVLLLRVFILSFSWFSLNLVYTGMTFSIGELIEGNIYINFLIQAVMEGLGYLLAFFLMGFFGRRLLLCAFMLLSGLSFVVNAVSVLLGIGVSWIPMVTYAVAKFGNTGAFQVIYVQANELMPTVVRNSAVGICTLLGQLGGVVSPYLAILDKLIPTTFGKSLPLFLFGASSSIAALLNLFLPETRNRALPDTIEESLDLKRRSHRKFSEEITVVM